MLRKPFCDFSGGGGGGSGPLSLSLDPRMFLGYSQHETSYSNIKHLGAGHIFIRSD